MRTIKWDAIDWDNTHFNGYDGDDALDMHHIGIMTLESGERVVALRFESIDGTDADKSATIFLNQDQADDLAGALRMSSRSL